MTNPDPRQVLSRLSDGEFFDRKGELDRLYFLAAGRPEPARYFNGPGAAGEKARTFARAYGLLLGAPRIGKTELLRKLFDRLFSEGAEVAPVYYSLKPYCLVVENFA